MEEIVYDDIVTTDESYNGDWTTEINEGKIVDIINALIKEVNKLRNRISKFEKQK
jgi:hypothetical protein